MEMKRPPYVFIASFFSLFFLWSCNDHILPAEEGDIWGNQHIIFTLAMLGSEYGPIVSMPLNSPTPEPVFANGMILNPPQGGRLVYITPDYGATSLQLRGNGVDEMIAMDDNYHRVTNVATLSSDGNTVAYLLTDPYGANSVHLYEVGGASVANPVLNDVGQVNTMLFSRSGAHLAMSMTPPSESIEIVRIYNRATWQPVAVLKNIVPEFVARVYIHWFQWMPDENDPRMLYVGSDGRGEKGLYFAFMDGRPPRKIVNGAFSFPAPSPDGGRVAFVRDNNLWLCNADGTGQQQITTVAVAPGERMIAPQWSPDGSKLMVFRVVASLGNPTATIDVVDVRTRRRKALTQSLYPGFWMH